MFRFINRLVVAIAIMLIVVGCASTSGSSYQRSQRVASVRAPVPISAAQQSDFKKALALMKKQKYVEAIPLLEAILA